MGKDQASWKDPEGGICIQGDVSRLRLKPDDALVMHSPHEMSNDTRARVRLVMEAAFPGHKCVVISDGLKLSIMEQSDEDGSTEPAGS